MSNELSYTRPQGAEDIEPDRFARRRQIEQTLLEGFSERGFRQASPPTVEYRDLYGPTRHGTGLYHDLVLARLGRAAEFPATLPGAPARPSHLLPGEPVYSAVLRPDLTTPLARMYVEQLMRSAAPPEAPTRWSAAGQVFRDRADGDLSRLEFRQIGAELFGAPGPDAELEVLRLAVRGVERLGLRGESPRRALMYLGHSELFRALLGLAGLEGDRLEAVGSGLVSASSLWLRTLLDWEQRDARPRTWLSRQAMELADRIEVWGRHRGARSADALRSQAARDQAEARALVGRIGAGDAEAEARVPALHAAHVCRIWRSAYGLGEPLVEALEGLVHLGFKPTERRLALRNLDGAFERLADHRGAIAAASERSDGLDRRQAEVDAQLRAFRGLCESLEADGSDVPLVITPSASRGFAYYTGVTFEVHAPTGAAETAICGGGRYDELPRRLFARAAQTRALRAPGAPAPAWLTDDAPALSGVGVAFGLERIEAL